MEASEPTVTETHAVTETTPPEEVAATETAGVPAADAPGSVEQQLADLREAQRQQHAEVAATLQQIKEGRAPAAVSGPAPAQVSAEDALKARFQELEEHDFYCPACGKVADYLRECFGKAEAPHPGTQVVSTDEVRNAPDARSDPDGYREWQAAHTAAPVHAS